jgi:hypothetical protein
MAATISHFDTENIKPQDNIPQLAGAVALKPAETLIAPAKPVEEQPAEAVEDEEAEDEEEDSEYEEEDEEDIDEDIDAEDEGEEIYPEDELSLEVDAPFAYDVEAKEAAELAKTLGFDTDAALSHLGQQEKRMSLTITKYAELISNSEKEVAQLYDGLTTEINNLRTSVDDGIRKISSDAQISMNSGAVGSLFPLIGSCLQRLILLILYRGHPHTHGTVPAHRPGEVCYPRGVPGVRSGRCERCPYWYLLPPNNNAFVSSPVTRSPCSAQPHEPPYLLEVGGGFSCGRRVRGRRGHGGGWHGRGRGGSLLRGGGRGGDGAG